MTPQDIFDKVLNGLRKQGKASVANGSCYYRSPDGCKCAVGLLMDDKVYDPKFELNSLANLLLDNDFTDKLPEYFRTHVGLLTDLQKAHDAVLGNVSYSPTNQRLNWELEMKRIACIYSLHYLPIQSKD